MALKITHERADMQRHLWVQAPIHVGVDGAPYRAVEWSLGGIAIVDAPPKLARIGQKVALRVELPFQGFDIGFDANGEVESWSAIDGRSVIAFRDLGERERELLTHFVDQLVRGNMTTVNDTIQRLDAPMAASLVAAQPGSRAVSATAARQFWRPLRTVSMTSLYGIGGAAALVYLGTLLYSNVFWLETQTSKISAATEQMVSLGDGVIKWAAFKQGDPVKAGDVVATVADSLLEREIEQAEIGIRERENKLAFLARRFENEKKRLTAFAGLSNLKSAKSNAEIDGLNAKLQSSQRELRQLPAAAAGAIAQVRQRIVSLKQAISLRELERAGLSTLAKENNGSPEFVGSTYLGEIDTIAAQIELAEADIEIAKQRHQSFLNQRDRLALRAPFDGVLRELPHASNANVRKGDVAAVFEATDVRRVTAYLRQDQVLRVQLGASAIVQVPATRQSFRATVTGIDLVHTSEPEPGQAGVAKAHRARGETGLAAVRLVLVGNASPEDAGVYRDGLPAVTMIETGRGRLPQVAGQPAAGNGG